MKQLILIIVSILFSLTSKANEIDSINCFDLTIKETFGCYSWVDYYKEFHYENEVFSITYCDHNQLKKQIFSKNNFYQFYDSLKLFKTDSFKTKYNRNCYGTASHQGIMVISINNKKIKEIQFSTLPCDSTNFMFLHQWLDKKAKSISSLINLNLLLSTNFYNDDFIYYYSVLKAISNNVNQFHINELFAIIDSTKNKDLKNVITASLKYFKDEKILDLIGPKIIQKMNNDNDLLSRFPSERQILLESFFAQDSCQKKIDYLKQFLTGKNEIIQLESAMELAKYSNSDGIEIIFKSIFNCENSKDYCQVYDEFIALINIGNRSTFDKMLANYERLKTIKNQKGKYNPWTLKNYIVAINLLTDRNRMITNDEFRIKCLDVKLDDEIRKLDERLKK